MNPGKIKILEKSFEQYWRYEQPILSDERFDELLRQLAKEHPDHPLLKKIGLNIKRGEEVQHKKPMLSLDKIYEFDLLQSWLKKVARSQKEVFVIQYKFDGLAARYEDGILCTRGDGKIGENITRRKKDIRLILNNGEVHSINVRKEPVLGELIIKEEDFEKFKNCEQDREFKNPRNFVAGMVNRKDDLPEGVLIDFVEYKTSLSYRFNYGIFTKELWDKIVEQMLRDKIYPIDGLVVKLEDEEYSDSLGYTTHHPNGQVAFKFYGKKVWTTLKEIQWCNGKGSLCPVGIVEPVQIGGVVVSKVTLHNAKFVEDLDLSIGDEIEIERAGEVIPHVLNRKIGKNHKVSIPNNCPTCGGQVLRSGPEIYCSNPDCQGTAFEKIRCSIECFGIDGLGIATIKYCYDNEMIIKPCDIFYLCPEDFLTIPGFQTVSANKLYNSIQSARTMEPATIMASLNTPGVGFTMYKKILEEMEFEELIDNVDFERLSNISGIGEKRAKQIKRSIRANKDYIQNMKLLVTIRKTVKKTGSKICFTGKMPNPRSYYEKLAESKGFQVTDSVNKDLDILVTTEIDRKSSKMETAKKFGIKIIKLEDWINELQ